MWSARECSRIQEQVSASGVDGIRLPQLLDSCLALALGASIGFPLQEECRVRRLFAFAVALLAAFLVASVPVSVAVARPVKTTPSTGGDQLWIARYDGFRHELDQATDSTLSSDGTKVFVTGYNQRPRHRDDYATVAYDAATGTRIWIRRFNGAGNGLDNATALAASPDSTRVFVTGSSLGSLSFDYVTVAYDAGSGVKLWSRRFDGLGKDFDRPRAIAVSPDGTTVFVAGESQGFGTETWATIATIAYDAATGAKIWVHRYKAPGPGNDGANDLVVSPNSARVYVAGFSQGSGSYVTLAYDADTGARIWARRYRGPGRGLDNASALALSPDGTRLFVTGTSVGIGSSYDYATIAYDAPSGATMWVRRYSGPDSSFVFDRAEAVEASPDGARVFVTGLSASPGPYDYATIAYNATSGEQIWLRRYHGPSGSSDFAKAMALSPDGARVYVTGASGGIGTYGDYATVAYDATTGVRIWVSRYDGPASDYDIPRAIAISPDGARVYVSGTSVGVGTDHDYATVAYDAG